MIPLLSALIYFTVKRKQLLPYA